MSVLEFVSNSMLPPLLPTIVSRRTIIGICVVVVVVVGGGLLISPEVSELNRFVMASVLREVIVGDFGGGGGGTNLLGTAKSPYPPKLLSRLDNPDGLILWSS